MSKFKSMGPLFAVFMSVVLHIVGCGTESPNEASSTSTTQEVITCPSGQTIATFQRGTTSPGPVADAGINAGATSTNYGANTSINAGQIGSPAFDRAILVRFDMSTLPTGATIQSATFGAVNGIAPVAGTVTASANAASWIESGTGSVTYATAPSYGAAIASNGNSGSAGSAFSMTIPAGTVQGWVTGANYGLRLNQASGSSNFFSSEYNVAANRLRLDVCYTVTPPTGCTDSIKNNLETDVDCGGGTCGACANGKTCIVGTDCGSGLCYQGTCYRRGGESTLPASSCTFATATPVTPFSFQYGTDPSNVQVCDVYAPTGATGAQMDVRMVSSGFTGGSRSAQIWIDWASYEVSIGRIAVVCDVRHAAASGVNSGPAEINDARCIVRQAAAMASTWGGSVPFKTLGDSAGGNLVILQAYTASLQTLASGNLTIEPDYTLDADGTCPIAWSSSDASYVSRIVALAPPTDLTVKAHIDAGAQPNMDLYVDCPTGESDTHYYWRAKKLSPIFYAHPGVPPLLIIHGTDDIVVYPEQSGGSGNVPVARTTGLIGTVPEAHNDGADATVIWATSGVHTPTFYPLATGSIYDIPNCTAMAF